MQHLDPPTSFTRDDMKRKNLFYKGQLVVIHSHTSEWDGEVGNIVRINTKTKRISVSRGWEVRRFGLKNVQDFYAWNRIQQGEYDKPHPQPINEARGILDRMFGDNKENNSDDELFADSYATNNNGSSHPEEAGQREHVTATNKEKQEEEIAKLINSNNKKKKGLRS
jgi:hypothetical protein